MAYCPTCGSNVEGRFCAKCGTAVPAGAPGAAAPPPGPPPAAPPPAYSQAQAPPPSYGPGPAAPPPPGYGTGAPPPPPGYGQPPPGYQQQGYPPPGAYAQSPGLQENLAGTLCYAVGWITGIVFLVMSPYNQNRNIKFHAWQSIFFFGGLNILWIVLSVISGIILSSLSFGLWSVFRLIMLLLDLVVLAAWIMLMYKAYNNQRLVLPIVGPLDEKQAFSS